MTAFFPGSFNPFTIGHLDILARALRIFDHVILGVGYNEHKSSSEGYNNIEHLKSLFEDCPNVTVMTYSGLTIDAVRKSGAGVIIRGFRNATDAEYERLLADTNRMISGNDLTNPDMKDLSSHEPIDTWLIPALPHLACISSSMVRELQHNNYDTSRFIPTKEECMKQLNIEI